jgi:UDP-N-acetylglucosamine:LPS N-acetylglucosamine transferase
MARVLLASMTVGGGHHALRDSFHQALSRADARETQLEPVPWDSPDRLVNWFYSLVVKHLPDFQGKVHALSAHPWLLETLSSLSPALLFEAQRVLRRQQPDVIVSSHFLLSMMFVKAKQGVCPGVPVINAVPDYGVPTSAFNPPQPHLRPDGLIVMAEDTQQHYLHTEQVTPDRVHLSGFLTKEAFSQVGARRAQATSPKAWRAEVLEALSPRQPQLRALDPALPTVLFGGGSAWAQKCRPVLDRLLAAGEARGKLNVLVVCGKDEHFRQELQASFGGAPGLAIFGHVASADYAQLMGLADFPVLGSLAPASMQELLETRCGPLLLFHFIPGTEQPHVAYIDSARIGAYEPDPDAMVELVIELAGLKPPSVRLAPLGREFRSRAQDIRDTSIARAHALPEFLLGVLKAPRTGRAEAV